MKATVTMAMTPKRLSRLLALYPPGFRDRYEDEMRDALEREHEHEQRRARTGRASRVAVAVFFVRTGLGLLAGAAAAWAKLLFRPGSTSLDLRSILRSLRKVPSFPVIVVLVVAVSVAVTTAVASFYRGTLFHRPAYRAPDTVVFAWGSNVVSGQLRDVIAGPNFLDLRASTRRLESLAALHPGSAVILGDGRPEVLDVLEVTVDFLDVLGVEPALGGNFTEAHRTSSGPDAVLLSHRFWRDRLEADPSIVGTTLVLDGRPHTVMGVLDEGLELFSPVAALRPLREDVLRAEDRTYHNYWMVGRLAAGATPTDASRELSSRMALIAEEDDPRLLGWSVLVEPLGRASLEAVRPLLIAIGAAVLLVVLAAALNLATLNLVRTLGRSRELFVRSLLGARRAELARVVLWETGLLCLVGAALGVAGGVAFTKHLAATVPTSVPIPGSAARIDVLHAQVDPSVLAIGLLLAFVMWLLVTAPALFRLGSGESSAGVRTTSSQAATRKLVVAELALATLLLVVAGLLERTAANLLSVDPGVEPEGLLTMYVGQLQDPLEANRARFFLDVVREVERVPGVVRAGVSDYVPFQGEDDYMGFRLADRPPPPPGEGLREEWRRVSEGFFAAAGLELRAGRTFDGLDYELTDRPRVAVVNTAFAAKYWRGHDPLGQRLTVARREYGEVEIVGVVEDVPARGPALPPPPMFFVPHHGWPRDNMALFVRVEGRPVDYIDRVREAVWSVDASQPIERVHTMTALVDSAVALPRLVGELVSRFASGALALSVLGLFGVTSYSVRVRWAELGIRLALGATPRRLKRDLLLNLAPLTGLGIALGVGAGIGAGYVGRSLLYGVSHLDPRTVALSAMLVAVASLVAAAVPARRVARIDPASSIRA